VKTVEHTITLHSPEPLGGRLPPVPFGKVLAQTGDLVALAVRMRLEGISRSKGRRPDWLNAASDIRYIGHSSNGNGATILAFDAPRIGEVVPDKLLQQDLFSNTPSAKDTPFDLIADAVSAVNAAQRDSNLFDNHLLKSLSRVGSSLSPAFDSAAIAGDRIPADGPIVANSRTFERAEELRTTTPRPHVVKVLGELDMIRYSTSAFGLRVKDAEAPCVLVSGNIDDLARLGRREVLVQGRAVFRPSGGLLRIEVDHFEEGNGQPELWRQLPMARSGKLDSAKYRVPQGPRSGINAIFGTWPGDETEEEFIAAISEPQQ
jgi:hypothetical protein